MSPLLRDCHLFYLVSLLGDEVIQQYLDQKDLTDRQLSLMKFAATLLLYLVQKEIDPIALRQMYVQNRQWYLTFCSEPILQDFDAGRLDWQGFLKMMEKIEALFTDDIWKEMVGTMTRLDWFHYLIKNGILTPDHVNRLTANAISRLADDDVRERLLRGWITIDECPSDTNCLAGSVEHSLKVVEDASVIATMGCTVRNFIEAQQYGG